MSSKAIFYITLTGFFFGTALVAGRFALSQFDPIVYVSLRLVLSTLAFLAVYTFAAKRYPWPRWGPIWRHAALLAIGTVTAMVCFTSSLLYLSSGLASIINTAGPALTVLLAHFVLADEKLTWRKTVGIVLAIGGALLLILRGESGLPDVSQTSNTGYLLLGIAIIVITANTVYIRRFTRDFDPFQITSIQVLLAGLVLTPFALSFIGIRWELITWEGMAALGYGAFIGTFVGFVLFLQIAQSFGATAAAMTNYVNPVFATLTGMFLLGETVTVGMAVGMAIIVAGVWLVNRPQRETT
ncbi:MAG: DMT family transporter [Chloroflexota bacterium]